MKKVNLIFLLISCLAITKASAQKQLQNKNDQSSKFYIKPYGGFIGIQDMNLQLVDNGQATAVNVENGFGYTAGISFGYNFTNDFSTEIGWEYKSNDISLTIDNMASNGDYASNFIYANGIYTFFTPSKLKPYLGLGLSYIQEIDLDFGTGTNTSFSQSANIGFQGLAGLDFIVAKKWAINLETKYVSFGDFDMENEANGDTLQGLRYNPFIVNIGLKYRF